MPEPAEHIEDPTRTVLINGRSRAYLECRRIRRRDYFLLERVGSPFRESYLAFDRLAGPGGSFFMVQSLPAGDAARQLLRVLSRLKSDNLPRAVEWQENRHQIDVALTWTEGISLADYQFAVSVLLYELLTLQLPYGGLGGKAGRPEFIPRAADTLVAPSQNSASCKQLPRSLRDRLDALVLRGLALKPENRYPDHNTWLNHWKEISALFHITPQLTLIENILTRVIGWFAKPDFDPKRTGGC